MPVSGPGDFDATIRAAQDGDEDAFVALYRAIHPGLLRYLRVLVGDHADDVASDTWAQVCRDLTRFSGDADGFRGWITTIGRNRAVDHPRYRARRPVQALTPERWLAVADAEDTAERPTNDWSTRDAITIIASLPPDQAEAVLLRIVIGLDAQTVSHIMGKRARAIRTLTYRGLKSLATRL